MKEESIRITPLVLNRYRSHICVFLRGKLNTSKLGSMLSLYTKSLRYTDAVKFYDVNFKGSGVKPTRHTYKITLLVDVCVVV